jgi:hypothetical protein
MLRAPRPEIVPELKMTGSAPEPIVANETAMKRVQDKQRMAE